jgi:hypothetical protein
MRTIAGALMASAFLWPVAASSQVGRSMATSPASHARPYKILKTAKVGGDGGYDYICQIACNRDPCFASNDDPV